MCGLYGVFGNGIIAEDMRVFQTLAFVNQLRGTDATGVVQVRIPFNNKDAAKVEIAKAAEPAQDFMYKRENRKFYTECTAHAVMGHNRFATVGDADAASSAHPFETQRYVGMHNGTLKENRYANSKDYATDSEALYNEITQNGMEETVSKLSKDSAFALAFFDKERETIGFIRNDKRPLCFAVHATRHVVYYSSSMLDLRFALNRVGVKNYHTYSLSPWKLVTCNPKTFTMLNIKPKEGEDFDEYRTNGWHITEFTPKPDESDVPVVKTYYYNDYGHQSSYSRGSQNRTSNFRVEPVDDGKRNFKSYNHCASCGTLLKYRYSEGHSPKWQHDFGSVCNECQDSFKAMGFNFDSTTSFKPEFTKYIAQEEVNGETNVA